MALNSSCSVSLIPHHSKPFVATTALNTSLSCLNQNSRSWIRSRCALGLLTLILALNSGDFFSASETQALESNSTQLVKLSRWSDKRKCPAWRANSLEIIVPENLPRPSHRRDWETVSADIINAPVIQVKSVRTRSVYNSKYCFSL